MSPWRIYLLSLMSSLAYVGYARGGTMAFYAQVGAAMKAAEWLGFRQIGTVGLATSLYVMATSNYMHPFGLGPNPLKHSGGS